MEDRDSAVVLIPRVLLWMLLWIVVGDIMELIRAYAGVYFVLAQQSGRLEARGVV